MKSSIERWISFLKQHFETHLKNKSLIDNYLKKILKSEKRIGYQNTSILHESIDSKNLSTYREITTWKILSKKVKV